MNYNVFETVKEGGFVQSEAVLFSRTPDSVVKVSDNEVYALYTDPQTNIQYKQTWTATGTGNTRTDFECTIEEV